MPVRMALTEPSCMAKLPVLVSAEVPVPLIAPPPCKVTMPTLSVVGGKSPAWLHHGMRALADVLPNAQLRVLEGQTHMVKAKVLAPLLIEFFGAGGSASGDLVAAGAQDASASLRRPRS